MCLTLTLFRFGMMSSLIHSTEKRSAKYFHFSENCFGWKLNLKKKQIQPSRPKREVCQPYRMQGKMWTHVEHVHSLAYWNFVVLTSSARFIYIYFCGRQNGVSFWVVYVIVLYYSTPQSTLHEFWFPGKYFRSEEDISFQLINRRIVYILKQCI